MSPSSTLDHDLAHRTLNDSSTMTTSSPDETMTKRVITTHPQYTSPPLLKSSLASNPIDQFSTWFNEVSSPSFTPVVSSPETVCLSTFNVLTSRISSRFVLLKQIDSRGLVFFTNYNSRKSQDIQSTLTKTGNVDGNYHVASHTGEGGGAATATATAGAMAFYWQPTHRQIRFTGTFEPLTDHENQTYFQSRPLDSKVSAWASPQSQPLESRQELESLVEQVQQRFGLQENALLDNQQQSTPSHTTAAVDKDKDIPLPPHWGGYRLVPTEVEFWVGRENRLHDRFVYTRPNIHTQDWTIQRLAP